MIFNNLAVVGITDVTLHFIICALRENGGGGEEKIVMRSFTYLSLYDKLVALGKELFPKHTITAVEIDADSCQITFFPENAPLPINVKLIGEGRFQLDYKNGRLTILPPMLYDPKANRSRALDDIAAKFQAEFPYFSVVKSCW